MINFKKWSFKQTMIFFKTSNILPTDITLIVVLLIFLIKVLVNAFKRNEKNSFTVALKN